MIIWDIWDLSFRWLLAMFGYKSCKGLVVNEVAPNLAVYAHSSIAYVWSWEIHEYQGLSRFFGHCKTLSLIPEDRVFSSLELRSLQSLKIRNPNGEWFKKYGGWVLGFKVGLVIEEVWVLMYWEWWFLFHRSCYCDQCFVLIFWVCFKFLIVLNFWFFILWVLKILGACCFGCKVFCSKYRSGIKGFLLALSIIFLVILINCDWTSAIMLQTLCVFQ